MKKLIAVTSLALALILALNTIGAAEIIVGGSTEVADYKVEHYLESHTFIGNTLLKTDTLSGLVGTTTEAKADTFLGYSASNSFKQKYIANDNSTSIAINYTMDGYTIGDVNCDGYIDLLDNAILQRKAAEWDGYDHSKACIYTSDINADGETGALDALMLLNTLASNENTIDETRTTVSFNIHGNLKSYELTPGDALNTLDEIIEEDFTRYTFIGWYDSTFTKKYTVVPSSPTTLYAKYENYTAYGFSPSSLYDPNNVKRFNIVKNPYGDGYVASSTVSEGTTYNGTLKGFVPGIYDGVSTDGFKIEKNKTYIVSLDYRFNSITDGASACTLNIYAASKAGIGLNGSKSPISFKSIKGSSRFSLKEAWSNYSFEFTNNSDYEYLFIRFHGTTSIQNTIYIDNLVIRESDDYSGVLLNVNGTLEKSPLSVGDQLPALEAIKDPLFETERAFLGWYDETLTTKYSTVTNGVSTYYALFDGTRYINFEAGGMYDPNGIYSENAVGGPNSWYRAFDPEDRRNITMRCNLSQNPNNTHFGVSVYDGIDGGYKLIEGKQYYISFDYYISASSAFENLSISVRGCADSNIGTFYGKTDSLAGFTAKTVGKWEKASLNFVAPSSVSEFPNLIILAQAKSLPNVMLYIDNVVIREIEADELVKIATPLLNVTFNENGNLLTRRHSYVGQQLPEVPEYYGASFVGWYDSELISPTPWVADGETEYRAKYDGSIINFSNGGYYDPNGRLGNTFSKFAITTDPTNPDNKVIKCDLTNDANNNNFCLQESGYSSEGYRLTIGNTYSISFMYYLEDNGSDGVQLQFRGCIEDNIGNIGGKSNPVGSKLLTEKGKWTGVTVSFPYNGTGLDYDGDHFLIMLAQDKNEASTLENCKSIIYFDNIVIKETPAQKSYTEKTVFLDGWTLGYTGSNRKLNIVVPTYNFSYVAMMQCENLVEVIKNTTKTHCVANIVHEDKWTETSNQSNIFIGDVTGHSRDNKYKVDASGFTDDDFAYTFAAGNIYVDGGSPYALAMAISELAKQLEECADKTTFTAGTTISGKYSLCESKYSSKDYYKPTFLEDFNGTEVNEDYWNIMDIGQYTATSVTEGKSSVRSKEHTNVKDGKLVISAAFDDKYYYGGMLRSHGKVQYKYGYLEASCIIPDGGGLWTAIWATCNSSSGLWESEIDVNESFGDASKAAFNMHRWPTSAGKDFLLEHNSLDHDGYGAKKTAYADNGKTFNDEFHTFGFYWDENCGKYIVDGDVIFEYSTKGLNKPAKKDMDIDCFNDYMSLIVSMTVGNANSSSQFSLDETADYWYKSNEYIVDYVHIYQIDGQKIMFGE